MSFKPETKQYKKAFNIEGESKAAQARFDNTPENIRLDARGLAGGALAEPLPAYISAPCEKVLQGANNTWLVFGRDRLQSRLSGYGGRGDTQAGAMDIVVGRLGSFGKSVDKNGQMRLLL